MQSLLGINNLEVSMDVTITKANESNINTVRQFYKDVGYSPTISDSEFILIAFVSNKIVGAVRLCDENGAMVLRGMFVDKEWQRKGIGTALLRKLDKIIGGKECFCLPHDYLEGFYGQIGFEKIGAEHTPPHLKKRLKEYEHIYSDLIAMRRYKNVIPTCNLPKTNRFGLFPSMPIIGIGTIWMGRRWPMDNQNYKSPSKEEIETYLKLAYESGIRMFDTAIAYGLSEDNLGRFFNDNSAYISDSFIATKWGEEFDLETEVSTVTHSKEHLIYSMGRSLQKLPKVDLLYIHKANAEVLSNSDIQREMLSLVDNGKIKYTGASISSESDLESIIKSGHLWVDFLQTGANVVRNRPELIESVFNKGIAVVVNAPVRKLPEGMTPKKSYQILAANPYVSFILTGTRTHLKETLAYFET